MGRDRHPTTAPENRQRPVAKPRPSGYDAGHAAQSRPTFRSGAPMLANVIWPFLVNYLILFVACYVIAEYGQNYFYDEATPGLGNDFGTDRKSVV